MLIYTATISVVNEYFEGKEIKTTPYLLIETENMVVGIVMTLFGCSSN